MHVAAGDDKQRSDVFPLLKEMASVGGFRAQEW
jgi:hypothetical protein